MGLPHLLISLAIYSQLGVLCIWVLALGRFTRGWSTQWPFGVIVHLALYGSHTGKRMFSHICFCPAFTSQGCPSIFWHGTFCLLFLHFPISFLPFSSFFLLTCISDGFLFCHDVSVSFLSDAAAFLIEIAFCVLFALFVFLLSP